MQHPSGGPTVSKRPAPRALLGDFADGIQKDLKTTIDSSEFTNVHIIGVLIMVEKK